MSTDIAVENQISEEEELALGDLRKILLSNEFDDAISEFNDEIKELEGLYSKVKNHTITMMDVLDGEDSATPRRMNTVENKKKVSPMYITAQTSNLIALKNLKINMFKQKNDLYQSKLDRAFKIVNQMTKDKKESDSGGDLPYSSILGMLLNAGIKIPISQGHEQSRALLQNNESAIDQELDDIIQSEGIETIDLSMANSKSKAITMGENGDSQDIEEAEFTDVPTQIYYDAAEDKLYLVTDAFSIIKEITQDEVEVEEQDDGTYLCNKFKLPVIMSEEPEEE